MNCQQCDNTGYRPIDPENRAAGVIPCDHRRDSRLGTRDPGLEPIRPSLHRLIESMENAALTPLDREIGALIQRHVGEANAIRICDIYAVIWPDERQDPKQIDRLTRGVKKSVERLRIFARLPIAATKLPPYGYFIAATAEECDAAFERYVQEGIKMFLLARLFKPRADLVQALRGQLELRSPVASSQSPVKTGNRELATGNAVNAEAG